MCEEIVFLHSEYKLHKLLDGNVAMHPPQQSNCLLSQQFHILDLSYRKKKSKNAKIHVTVKFTGGLGAFVSLVKFEIM